jgi:hypothetical protein
LTNGREDDPYVTPGYRLVALDAKTGLMIRVSNRVVDPDGR